MAVVATIYSTLGLTGRLAGTLRDAELLSAFFALGMALIGVAIAVQGLLSRPGSAEVAVALGVAAACFMVFVRMGSLEERTHLIEYGIVALLIHAALNERAMWRPHVPAPAQACQLRQQNPTATDGEDNAVPGVGVEPTCSQRSRGV